MQPITRRTFTTLTGATVAGALLSRTLPALAAEPRAARASAPPRLIVRGDDMGYAHDGNLAIIASHVNGIESSIEVLAPSPWFPEAARMLGEHPDVDVGVHLALTSEWDNVKWRPLTTAPSLRDADGFFYPKVVPDPRYPKRSVSENPWRLEDVEREFRAQIELVKKHIPRVSHVSGHMGCTGLSPEVRALTARLIKEYDVDVDTQSLGVVGARYDGAHATSAEKIESFVRMLDKLEDGKTYLFVDHPGLDGAELRGIHHIGYENVAEDRQGVTDTFTSARVKERIASRGIRLIGYRDLKR
jgi:chitin disaccharide deacetylase